MAPYETQVVEYAPGFFRIVVRHNGMAEVAGPRHQRGTPGSGNLFTGSFHGHDRAALERDAVALADYLNKFEETRKRTRRRSKRR